MSALRILKRQEIVDAMNVLMQADQLKTHRFNVSCEDLLKPEVREIVFLWGNAPSYV